MIAAIITAKGGNNDKNLVKIQGLPALCYQINAAKRSRVHNVFVTTECPRIKAVALEHDAVVIDRPRELALPTTNHGNVIVHAAEYIQQHYCNDLTAVVILLGNTVMVEAGDIDACLDKLAGDVDSVMTVWRALDDHPFRAMTICNGYLQGYFPGTPDTNRQSYPIVYFYDQGVWAVKYTTLLRCKGTREGPGPWWWMGKKCVAVERPWITGRDFHSELDFWIAEKWRER